MVIGFVVFDEDKVMGRLFRLLLSFLFRILEYEVGFIKFLLKIVFVCGLFVVLVFVWFDRVEIGGFNIGGEGMMFWIEVEEDVL